MNTNEILFLLKNEELGIFDRYVEVSDWLDSNIDLVFLAMVIAEYLKRNKVNSLFNDYDFGCKITYYDEKLIWDYFDKIHPLLEEEDFKIPVLNLIQHIEKSQNQKKGKKK